MEPKVLKHTARADAFVSQRAPPRAPALATHGLNVCCKKTNRAPQRTYPQTGSGVDRGTHPVGLGGSAAATRVAAARGLIARSRSLRQERQPRSTRHTQPATYTQRRTKNE